MFATIYQKVLPSNRPLRSASRLFAFLKHSLGRQSRLNVADIKGSMCASSFFTDYEIEKSLKVLADEGWISFSPDRSLMWLGGRHFFAKKYGIKHSSQRALPELDDMISREGWKAFCASVAVAKSVTTVRYVIPSEEREVHVSARSRAADCDTAVPLSQSLLGSMTGVSPSTAGRMRRAAATTKWVSQRTGYRRTHKTMTEAEFTAWGGHGRPAAAYQFRSGEVAIRLPNLVTAQPGLLTRTFKAPKTKADSGASFSAMMSKRHNK